MQRRFVLMLFIALPVAGCGRVAGSSLNPFRWFGRSRRTRGTNPDDRTPLVDPSRRRTANESRVLIAQIESMQIERTPGGAIVTAIGIAAAHGFYDAALVRVGVEDGVLTYDFRAASPAEPVTSGTVSSRRITVADTLTTNELADIRTITVRGALNGLSSSR